MPRSTKLSTGAHVFTAAALTLCAGAPVAVVAQSVNTNALTAEDLLGIRTVTPGDFSPDGKWLVIRIGRRSDGLGYVAAREGDPSYTRPSGARVLLMNSET